MFKFIPLINKYFIVVSILFCLLFTNNAFCDAIDPAAVLKKCTQLNQIGSNAQNKPQMLIGCWRAVSNLVKVDSANWSQDPDNSLASPDALFFYIGAYLVFDTDGSQYSCVSNQLLVWKNYNDIDAANFQKLFDSSGKPVPKSPFSVFNYPTFVTQQIYIDTGSAGKPRLEFTFVRDTPTANKAPGDLYINSILTSSPDRPYQTVCTSWPSATAIKKIKK